MVFVTGGTGLVGSHLLAELTATGIHVRALKRKNSKISIVDDLIDFYGLEKKSEIEWIDGDILDFYLLKDVLKGVKHVYHAAAMVSLTPAKEKQMREINETGTANMLNASIEAGVAKFAFVSSIATLGNSVNGYPVDESCMWQADEKHYPYAETKFRAEMEVQRASMEGLKTIIVNPSYIIGPGDTTRSSIQLFSEIKKGMPFYTTGSTGYVHARDVASALIMLMESDIENERFVLSSENRPLKYVFDVSSERLNVKPPKIKAGKGLLEIAWRIEYLKSLITGKEPLISKISAEISTTDYKYSGQKLIDATGFKYRSLNEAINDTIDFMQKYGY
ncbi:MAG: NAD-dependent epimerase/dehydratase family protein [Chlorobi bacterium]|nr:NAD-dependent epimerase/dehydratase family protein [Chlorobiota bacterium]